MLSLRYYVGSTVVQGSTLRIICYTYRDQHLFRSVPRKVLTFFLGSFECVGPYYSQYRAPIYTAGHDCISHRSINARSPYLKTRAVELHPRFGEKSLGISVGHILQWYKGFRSSSFDSSGHIRGMSDVWRRPAPLLVKTFIYTRYVFKDGHGGVDKTQTSSSGG